MWATCELVGKYVATCDSFMLNHHDLGFMLVGLKSFVISSDYRVYMCSSMMVWSFRWLLSYLCSYKSDGSVTKPRCPPTQTPRSWGGRRPPNNSNIDKGFEGRLHLLPSLSRGSDSILKPLPSTLATMPPTPPARTMAEWMRSSIDWDEFDQLRERGWS
jgi:hypothetical protein